MTIRRQYSLPNCTLILDGFSEDSTQKMSILLNAQCYFMGVNQVLSGGKVFLTSLVETVSAYGQGCLSGLYLPQAEPGKEEKGKVSIEPVPGKHLHRLTWEPPSEEKNVEVELTTVQLFDLLEAVDRLLTDPQTLPDLTLQLQSVSKRYRQREEPLLQRATPPILGIGSFVLAAMAFVFLPVPEVPKPEEPKPEERTTETVPLEGTPTTIPITIPPPEPSLSPETPEPTVSPQSVGGLRPKEEHSWYEVTA